MNIEYEIKGEGRLEGGDYICTSGIAFIGCGMRTNYNAIQQLMENDLFSGKTVVVVKDQLQIQEQMHLDCYFNVIAKYKVVLGGSRLHHKGGKEQPLVDEWVQEYNEEAQKYHYVLKQDSVDFEK